MDRLSFILLNFDERGKLTQIVLFLPAMMISPSHEVLWNAIRSFDKIIGWSLQNGIKRFAEDINEKIGIKGISVLSHVLKFD